MKLLDWGLRLKRSTMSWRFPCGVELGDNGSFILSSVGRMRKKKKQFSPVETLVLIPHLLAVRLENVECLTPTNVSARRASINDRTTVAPG